MEQNKEENIKKYWDGWTNKSIRYYFYVTKGLDMFNSFRYLLMAIFALYYMLKLSNPIIFVLFFILSCVFLGFVGYITVHHIGKVIDFLSIEFATHWSKYSFNLQERQVKAMEKLAEEKK
jgi:hypothetical protein